MRRLAFLWLILAAASLSIAAETTSPANSLDAKAPLNPPSRFAINGVGIMHHPRDDEGNNKRFALLRELGVRWDRTDFWWSDFEKQPGKWEFELADKVMRDPRAKNVQVLPILDYGARWRETEAPDSDEYRAQWADYVTRVVSRFKGYADTWEVWNEPNIIPFWRPQPNPGDYARLLKITAEKARAANPAVKLVGFALAGLDLPFLERVLEQSGVDCFDKVSYHFYRVDKPEERIPDEINELRLTLQHFGKKCPIWITEMGVTSNFREGVSEEMQAVYLMRQIMMCISGGIERIFPFTLMDNTQDPGGDWGCQLGLITLGGRKKPAFQAYKTMIAQLDNWDFAGEVYFADQIKAYLFEPKPGHKPDPLAPCKLVAWSIKDATDIRIAFDATATTCTPGKPKELPFLSDLNYVTLNGDTKPLEFGNNTARVGLSPSLVYVPVKSSALEENARTAWSPVAIMSSPGYSENARIEIAMTGVLPESVKFTAPEGWQLKRTGPSVTFTVPADARPDWYSVRAQIPADSGTVIKELRVWVRPAVRTDVRPVVTTSSREAATSFRVHNLNLREPIRWRFEAKPIIPGFDWPTGVIGEGTNRFAAETSATVPRSAFESIRTNTVINFVSQPIGSAGQRGASTRAFQIAVLPMAKVSPVIDGDLREYGAAQKIQLGERDQMMRGKYTGARTATAEVSLLWTKEGFYVGADITDEQPMMNKYGAGGDIYKGDGIELYIGTHGYGGEYFCKKDTGQFHFALSPGKSGEGAVVSDFEKPLPGSSIVAKSRPGGYTLEAFVPASAMAGYTPSHGDVIGWDVQLNNRDDYSESSTGESFMWNGDDLNWLKAGKWGMAVLK